MDIKEQVFKYGVILRKRKKADQKLRFLSTFMQDLETFGVGCNIYQSTIKKRKSYILYSDNIAKAKVVLITHYDNPDITILMPHKRPFNERELRRSSMVNLLLFTLLIIGAAILFYVFVASAVFGDGVHTIMDVLCYLVFFVFATLSAKVSSGIESRKVFVNNTLSVICLLAVAKHNALRDDIAYVLVDAGNADRLGYIAFKESVTTLNPSAHIIALDMVGVNRIVVNDSGFNAPILESLSNNITLVGGVSDELTLSQELTMVPKQTDFDEAVAEIEALI